MFLRILATAFLAVSALSACQTIQEAVVAEKPQACQFPTALADAQIQSSLGNEGEVVIINDTELVDIIVAGINKMPPPTNEVADEVRIYRWKKKPEGLWLFALFNKDCFVMRVVVEPDVYGLWMFGDSA